MGGWIFRLATGVAGAFTGATLGWVGAAVVSGGDARSGMAGLVAAIVLGAGAGMLGLRARSRSASALLAVGTLASLVFWTFVPSGWWALPPPRAGEVQVRPAQ